MDNEQQQPGTPAQSLGQPPTPPETAPQTAPKIESLEDAFAYLNSQTEQPVEGDTKPGEEDTNTPPVTESTNTQETTAVDKPADVAPVETDNGATVDNAGASKQPNTGTDQLNQQPATEEVGTGWTEKEVEEELKAHEAKAEERAVEAVAKLCREKGIMQDAQGRLGAFPEHPAIKSTVTNPDGTISVRYKNPETGEFFKGDDPGQQALNWCNRYNEKFRNTFGELVKNEKTKIIQDEKPWRDMVAFSPKYDALDETRQALLDAVLEGKEVFKDGEHIGYSVDLDDALATVERQISNLSARAQAKINATTPENKPGQPAVTDATQGGQQTPPPPTTPALDMPASGATTAIEDEEPKDLAEAMQQLENKKLAQLQKGKK